MKKVQVVSDLHLEFCKTQKEAYGVLGDLTSKGTSDILIVAGDLVVSGKPEERSKAGDLLKFLCSSFPYVIFVPGNHDFYGDSIERANERFESLGSEISNLHVLQNKTAVLYGNSFHGTTMWFKDSVYNSVYSGLLSDFTAIENFRQHVYEECARAERFLQDSVDAGSIVITHHLPHNACISRNFMSSNLNRFFVCNMENLICTQKPALWIHGHTHEAVDTVLCETRVLCNPRGYPTRLENLKFTVGPTFEIEEKTEISNGNT